MNNGQTKLNKYSNESHDFYMIKTPKETIIHDNRKEMFNYNFDLNTEIYKYDEQHKDFLEALSKITSNYEELENSLKEYYEFAKSPYYNPDTAKENLRKIKKSFEEIHIFLRSQDLALLHIKQVLYEYFCTMTNFRFIEYLSNHNQDSFVLKRTMIDAFYEQDKNYLKALFSPLSQLYNELYWEHKNSEISCPPYNDNTLEEWINQFINNNKELSQTRIDHIRNKAENTHILYRFQIIVDIFTDYFSIFSKMQSFYPNTKVFHQYALILTNHYFFSQIISECNFYSIHQSMYKIIYNYLLKNANPLQITTVDKFIEAQTDFIYNDIKESIDLKDSREQVTKKLLTYYPNKFEEYMNTEIIEFQYFEQLLAIELLDILVQNKTIQKCPKCNNYFIASNQGQRYCDKHKNNPQIRQKVYTEKKDSLSKIYQKYYNRIHQKISRAEGNEKLNLRNKFEKWNQEAKELILDKSVEISQEDFSKKLEDLCVKNGIPSRYKHVKHKKDN